MNIFSPTSKIGLKLNSIIKGYNHQKYWKRRSKVVNPNSGTPWILKVYYLFWIKRTDAKFCCSFGTNLNSGAEFATPPHLPHGPYGIIIGHNWKIGKKAIIYHQVTLAGRGEIGDNVLLGAGAKVLSGCKIGDRVKVDMNAVVIEDIPSDSTVVLQRPRILHREDYDNN